MKKEVTNIYKKWGIPTLLRSYDINRLKFKTAVAFLKFIFVGSIGLGITLTLTFVLTHIAHFWYFWSYLTATAIAWTFVFFANALHTFAVEGQSQLTWKRYTKFILSYLTVFWVGAGTVYVLTSLLYIPYLISIVIGTVTTTGLTFSLSNFVIFSSKKRT